VRQYDAYSSLPFTAEAKNVWSFTSTFSLLFCSATLSCDSSRMTRAFCLSKDRQTSASLNVFHTHIILKDVKFASSE